MLNQKNLDKLVTESLSIEMESAKKAGALGFMARALVQATMPHKNPGDIEAWSRKNGNFSMVIHPGIIQVGSEFKRIGLPYGAYPRLLLAWITTEAVKTKEPILILGDSLSSFMNQLGLNPTGGRWGNVYMLKEQINRLFSAFISCTYQNSNDSASVRIGKNLYVASSYELWWNPKNPEQENLWKSKVTLGFDFFREIIDRPIPLDIRALKALKGSSMRLDIYAWLTYRMSYLKNKTVIPWEILQLQFGSNFHRKIDFKRNFLSHLKAVQVIYSEIKIDYTSSSLLLYPSKSHIPIF